MYNDENNNYNNGYNNTYNYDAGYNNGYDNSYNNGYGSGYQTQSNYFSNLKQISNEAYNLIIGGVLLYGFVINCIMTKCFGDSITRFMAGNYLAFFITYIVMVVVGTLMVNKSDNPVISFIGYNFIVVPLGMVLSSVLTIYNLAGYSDTITLAFALTAVVTLVMMFAATIFPSFFLSIGRTLFFTLLITFIAELFFTFVLHAELGIFDYIVVLIFCGYIGYDWAKANAIPKTVDNAVDSAAELYVDIINLFLRLLRILARANNN